jgi:hypothetical protein
MHHMMQREKPYKLQGKIIERLDKKERIRLFSRKHFIFAASKSGRSHFRPFSKQKNAVIK